VARLKLPGIILLINFGTVRFGCASSSQQFHFAALDFNYVFAHQDN